MNKTQEVTELVLDAAYVDNAAFELRKYIEEFKPFKVGLSWDLDGDDASAVREAANPRISLELRDYQKLIESAHNLAKTALNIE